MSIDKPTRQRNEFIISLFKMDPYDCLRCFDLLDIESCGRFGGARAIHDVLQGQSSNAFKLFPTFTASAHLFHMPNLQGRNHHEYSFITITVVWIIKKTL